MSALIAMAVIMLLIGAGAFAVKQLSPDARDRRQLRKTDKRNELLLTKQLRIANTALIKIAAGDSGNPSLDANIALEDIQNVLIKELES